MAELLTRVPDTLAPMLDEIKEKKRMNSEPTTRKAIITEAVKLLYKREVKGDAKKETH